MSVDIFKIQLQDSALGVTSGNPVYKPGDEIQGSVILKNAKLFLCLGIEAFLERTVTVKRLGRSDVESGARKERLPLRWTRVNLLGNPLGGTDVVSIPPGRHTYEFRILLRKLNPFPGTFECSYGKLDYKIVALIKKVALGSDFIAEKPVVIRSYLNLASLAYAMDDLLIVHPQRPSIFADEPEDRETKFVCNIHRMGYCPGQMINFKIRISKADGMTLEKLSVSLCKNSTFTAADNTLKTIRTILDSKFTMDPKKMNFDFGGWSSGLTVPLDCYPSVMGTIITHSYFIRVEVSANGVRVPPACSKPLMVTDALILRNLSDLILRKDIPITIGTVNETVNQATVEVEDSFRELSLSLASSPGGSMSSLPRYSELSSRASSLETLPPSYEDAVAGPSFQN